MLASEIKARNMLKQREYIEGMVDKLFSNNDGDMCFTYAGVICSENISYFTKKGVSVNGVNSPLASAITGGRPIYLISVVDAMVTDDELQKAKDVLQKEKEAEASAQKEDGSSSIFYPFGASESRSTTGFPSRDGCRVRIIGPGTPLTSDFLASLLQDME